MIAWALAFLLALFPTWQLGEASWYARGLRRPDALTAASRDFPRGTCLVVLSLDTWRAVEVTVNDYGPDPADPLGRTRCLDLSRGAARRLGLIRRGAGLVLVIPVTAQRKLKKNS